MKKILLLAIIALSFSTITNAYTVIDEAYVRSQNLEGTDKIEDGFWSYYRDNIRIITADCQVYGRGDAGVQVDLKGGWGGHLLVDEYGYKNIDQESGRDSERLTYTFADGECEWLQVKFKIHATSKAVGSIASANIVVKY